MTLGRRIKDRRLKMRMNQKELSAASNLSQATISRIENGRVQQLKSENLKRLAIALGVTVDYLIGRTDRIRPDDVVEADPKAKYLFRGYEKLSAEGKKQVEDFVRFLEKRERQKEKRSSK